MIKIIVIVCLFIFFKSKSQTEDNPGTPVLPYYHIENLEIAKEIPLSNFLQNCKGSILIYIKFESRHSPEVKAIYIFSVRLSNGEELLKYNTDSINLKRMQKGKPIKYPKQIEKMMEYVRRFVGCLEFRLSNVKEFELENIKITHQGYLIFGIPVNQYLRD